MKYRIPFLLLLGVVPLAARAAQPLPAPAATASEHHGDGEETGTSATEPAAPKPDPAADKYWQAIKLLNSKSPAEREAGKTALQGAVDLEYIHALIQLAQCHLTAGYGFKKDERRAVDLLRLAAERGNGYALVSLASCHLTGTGTRRDEAKATELLQRALAAEADFDRPVPPPDFEFGANTRESGVVGQQAGDPAAAARAQAHFLLGTLLAKAKKTAEAQTHFVAAAEAGPDGRDGISQAAVAAALNYAFGEGVPRDLARANALLDLSRRLSTRQGVNLIHNYSELKLVDEFAIADLEQNAEKMGLELETDLQLRIASQFADKKSKDYNPAEAARWYELAAENGQGWAMVQLGLLHARGELGQPDLAQAFRWFERAGSGDKPKHYLGVANLAICHQHGLGTPKDPAKADALFRQHRKVEFVCHLGSIGQCPATSLSFEESAALLESWAKRRGDAQAQYLYGLRHLYGIGVKADRDAAVKWLKKAAKAKHGGALCMLGLMAEETYTIYNGMRLTPVAQLREAADYYRQGSDAGDADATANLATLLMNGTGVTRDLDQAEAFLLKCIALDPKHARAYSNLGALYEGRLRESIREKNPAAETRFRELMLANYQKSLQMDFAYAANNLGALYLDGKLVPQDFTRAYEYYEKAASLGLSSAHFPLGEMHAQGQGVPVTPTEAAYHYRLAALDGHMVSLHRLADFYVSGKGVSPDPDRAIFWLQRLAAVAPGVIPTICDLMIRKGEYERTAKILLEMRSDPRDMLSGYAHFRLSNLYQEGLGVKKNPGRAKKYLEIAVKQGNAEALTHLGLQLMGEKKTAEGLAAFERATQGPSSGEAHFYLGQLYYFGTHVPKDVSKGIEYFRAAAKHNNPEALYYLAALTFNEAAGAPTLDEAVQLATQAETLGLTKATKLRNALEKRRQETTRPAEQTARPRSP